MAEIINNIKNIGTAIFAVLFIFLAGNASAQVLISGASVSDVTETSALIRWSSSDKDELTFVKILYGTSEHYDKAGLPRRLENSVSGEIINFETRLNILSKGTTYYYKIQVGNSLNQSEVYSGSFTTLVPDTEKPVLTNITTSVQSESVTISWFTNEPSDCLVEYNIENGPVVAKYMDDFVTEHHVSLPNLTPNSNYYYKIYSTDKSGNSSESSNGSFKTNNSLSAPPDNVTNLSITASSAITLRWTNPKSADFYKVLIYKNIGSPVSSRLDGNPIFSGKAEVFTDRDVEKGRPYFYTVYVQNNRGFFSSGLVISGSVGVNNSVPLPPASSPVISANQFNFYFKDRKIPLVRGSLTEKEGVEFSVLVPRSILPSTPEIMVLKISGVGTYQFSDEDGTFTVNLKFPPPGKYESSVQINYMNGSVDLVPFAIQSQAIEKPAPPAVITPVEDLFETAAVIKEISGNEGVKKTVEQVIFPTLTGATIFNLFISILIINLTPLIRYLFIEPWLLFVRRRGTGWGKVYDSVTKNPVDLAMVRLINKETGKIIQSKVTDSQGRFAFSARPGEYLIQVSKNGYIFPSEIMKGLKKDGQMFEIYNGKTFTLTSKDSLITANIPIDPPGKHNKPRRLIYQTALSRTQFILSWAGLGLTIFSLIFTQKWFFWPLIFFQISLFFLARRIKKPAQKKTWGVVYDSETRKPIDRAIVRLYNKSYNRLISTQVTDGKGKYYFLAKKDKYYIDCEAQGYENEKTPIIDLNKEQNITLDISMDKK